MERCMESCHPKGQCVTEGTSTQRRNSGPEQDWVLPADGSSIQGTLGTPGTRDNVAMSAHSNPPVSMSSCIWCSSGVSFPHVHRRCHPTATSICAQQNQRILPLHFPSLGNPFCLFPSSPKPLHPTLAPSQSPKRSHGPMVCSCGCRAVLGPCSAQLQEAALTTCGPEPAKDPKARGFPPSPILF